MPDAPENFIQQLLAARGGSPDELAWLLENCRPYLLRIANEELDADLRAKLGASDLVQQSVIEAQRDFAGFQGATGEELLAWLRRILRHNLDDARRHYRETAQRRVSSELPLADPNGASLGEGLIADITPPLEGSIARERTEALERAVERLTPEYRQVLTLRYDENRSFAEIGAMLGRSEEAARKLWLRAVRRLRGEVRGLHDSV
jgi:RNA polymerase sigma-70 factor (ECF subfamily)